MASCCYLYFIHQINMNLSTENTSRSKQAWLQGTPAKSSRTFQWLKRIQLVSVTIRNCWTRNEVKILCPSRDILCKRTKQSGWKNSGAKTQEPHWQTAWNKWTNLLFLWMPNHITKISIKAQFSLSILKI